MRGSYHLALREQVDIPDLEAMTSFGASFGATLRAGDVVALDAPMGAGKTTLVRAVATALGADPSLVSSPTFVIVHEYDAPTPIVHIDAWRLGDDDDLDALGWDRLFDDTIVLIEWPDRIADGIPASAIRVGIEITGPGSRLVTIERP